MAARSSIHFPRRLNMNAGHSNLRLVCSMAVYCSLQAFIILGIGEYALPTSFTGGQGSISMWRSVMVTNPELWLNAVNNSVYWLALSFLLREPVGAILVVLGFLAASFLVDPFQQVVGLESGAHIPPGAVVLGTLGALLCVGELPLTSANAALARLRAFAAGCFESCPGCSRHCRSLCATGGGSCAYSPVPLGSEGAGDAYDEDRAEKQLPLSPSSSEPASAGSSLSSTTAASLSDTSSIAAFANPQPLAEATATAATAPAANLGRRSYEDVPLMSSTGARAESSLHSSGSSAAAAGAHGAQTRQTEAADSGGCCGQRCGALRGAGHGGAVLAAFAILAITTATGITLTTWMQARAGLSAFGYTAVDQVLLPFTTLPLVALLERVLCMRRLVGEPRWSNDRENSPSFVATLWRTWREVMATPQQLCPEDALPTAAADESRNTFSAAASHSLAAAADAEASSANYDLSVSGSGLPSSPTGAAASNSAPDIAASYGSTGSSAPAASGVGGAPRRPGSLHLGVGQRHHVSARAAAAGCCTSCRRLPIPAVLLRPWPMFFTLAAFHGLEFVRTFLFFILVTQFDTETTYVSMTLVRILLVAGASLLACTLLRRWVGISAVEAAGALHPINLAMRGAGACALVVSILLLKGLI